MKQLIIFSGLPCTGKSSLATMLVKKLDAIILSVDPIEAAMMRSGVANNHNLGMAAYEIVNTLADQNLIENRTVIIDAVSPVEWSRNLWRMLAKKHKIKLKIIECVLKDVTLHKERVENRVRNIAGYPEITWEKVLERRAEYEPWTDDRLTVDSSTSLDDNLTHILKYIKA